METIVNVVLPAKNEGQSITRTVQLIQETRPTAQVIVVDDGSTDDTADKARAAGAHVITHPYSMGNGAAIKTGARAADADVLIFMDADGQHDPADIPRMLEALDKGYDMVVGARQKGSQANRGRGLANAFYNRLASYMTGHKVEDLTSGFRAVRADKFREFLYLLPNGFSYPTTITMAFFRAGYTVRYVPIHAAKRVGKSHIKPLQDGLRFLLIIFRIGTLYSPLKIFVPIAALQGLVGLSYYAYTFFTMGRLTGGTVFLLTSALTIFLIGLVSEQITQLMYKDSGTGGHRNEPTDEDGPRT
ncbi:glycosyltransferase family 2 protein [Ectothiorhodospira haloalkaliphila]|uniref:glycosyltransferase family 2 protein n=1 Tax=Ectothiorhodospira haloalkaliphila TaxID=421628 RepID=UPI001EE8F1CA|nr:glycosyltransferase family 2 protein [Ectothiorhodospira haloalkaliphila]MCG5526265.1 glycosyltransferase family 2 protein [Ectothiorhodospira haloalkaliphila]